MRKKSIKFDQAIQIGFMVYGYAKLIMLQFYFDVIDYYIDRSDYTLMQMDTGRVNTHTHTHTPTHTHTHTHVMRGESKHHIEIVTLTL